MKSLDRTRANKKFENLGSIRTGRFPYLATCGSLAETTNESADEGPIETLENPNTLEDAVNLQVQENLKKLRKFYGIECIRNDRRISIRRVFNHHSDWSIRMIG